MKHYLTPIVLCLSVLSFCGYASEIYVDPGELEIVNTAVAQASDGDVIIMNPGVYFNCTVPIVINKNVTIRGIGATIDCSGGT